MVIFSGPMALPIRVIASVPCVAMFLAGIPWTFTNWVYSSFVLDGERECSRLKIIAFDGYVSLGQDLEYNFLYWERPKAVVAMTILT